MELQDNSCIKFNAGNINTVQQGITLYDHRTMYIMQTAQTIGNTDVETTFFNDTNAIGTRVIPANLIRVGTVIRARLMCDLSSVGNPVNEIKIKIGSVTLITSSATLGASHTNDFAQLEFDIVFTAIGVTGSCLGMGRTNVSGISDVSRAIIVPATEINTTIENRIDVTYKRGTANAGNILSPKSVVIQLLN